MQIIIKVNFKLKVHQLLDFALRLDVYTIGDHIWYALMVHKDRVVASIIQLYHQPTNSIFTKIPSGSSTNRSSSSSSSSSSSNIRSHSSPINLPPSFTAPPPSTPPPRPASSRGRATPNTLPSSTGRWEWSLRCCPGLRATTSTSRSATARPSSSEKEAGWQQAFL
jgi:hypothetical protein